MKTKKELKKEYLQLQPIMGVFQIKNLENNLVFIDASTDVIAKWNRHQTELRFGSHRNKKLQKDWNKFKYENFNFEIISELKIKEGEVNINYNEEVKLLKEMVLEEMNLLEEMKY